MSYLQSKPHPVLRFSLIIVCLLFAGGLYAGEPIRIAGTMVADIIREDSVALSDVDGHLLSWQVYEGINTSTADSDFMSNATVRNISFADMIMGTGRNQGYCEFAKDGDMLTAKWEGKVTTSFAADSTMITAFEGAFSYVGGTGKLKNISGKGTYSGKLVSATKMSIDWQGEYTLGN